MCRRKLKKRIKKENQMIIETLLYAFVGIIPKDKRTYRLFKKYKDEQIKRANKNSSL